MYGSEMQLSDYYNHTMAGGKWNHMMDQVHLGYTTWSDPKKNTLPDLTRIEVPAIAGLGVAVEGSEFAWLSSTDKDAALASFDPHGPPSQYLEIFNRGKAPFTYTCVPSTPWIRVSASHGTVGADDQRVEVSIDWTKVPGETSHGTVAVSGADGPSIAVHVTAARPSELAALRSAALANRPGAFVESQGYVAMEVAHFTHKTDTSAAHWDVIPNYGRTLSSMSIFPVTAPSMTLPNAPCLEYRMYLSDTGHADVSTIIAPSLNFVPGRGLRYAVSLDDQTPQIVDVYAHETSRAWGKSVVDNCRVTTTGLTVDKIGYHTLKIWMIDLGIVLQKLIVDFGGVKPSYLGPPESNRLEDASVLRK